MPSSAPLPVVSTSEASGLPAPWLVEVHLEGPEERLYRLVDDVAGSPGVSARVNTRVALFDGVLHNREALVRELGAGAVDDTDADLVRRAYERWKLDFASHFTGLFVAVVVDPVDEVCVAVRDPLGAYPLYYAASNGRLLLSTSVGAIRRQPGVSSSLNRAVLAEHLCHRWLNVHDTFFEAIHRVPPGYLLRGNGGTLSVSRYWDPVPADRPVEWLDEDEVNERFEAAFEEAVAQALTSGSTGVFLSGGLDSISVAAMATDLAGRRGVSRPLALSLGFPGDSSEEFEQRSVAAALGLDHEFVPFEDATHGAPLLTAALAITRLQGAPLLNTWMPAYTDLALRGRRRGVRAILSGAGGDEWLSVTPCLAADLIRGLDVKGLARLCTAWKRSYTMSTPSVLRTLLWTFGARPLASSMLAALAPGAWKANRIHRNVSSTPSWVAPGSNLRSELRTRLATWLPPAVPPRGFYLEDVRNSLEHPLTSMELEEIFEMGQRLEVRFLHPYWDARVTDILYRTPPLLLFSGGRAKGLVRETMARRFPKLGLDRQKKRAGTAYFNAVLDREIPSLWQVNGTLTALADLAIVEPRGAAAMAEDALRSNVDRGLARIWSLVNVEAWVRAHQ